MIGYQDKINQILKGAETIKNMDNDIDLELSVSVLTKTLKDVQLERDALWVKTQEDEREINDLRDINNELRKELEKLKELHTLNFMSDMLPMEKLQKQRDEAIRLATLFQALYLRYGKAEDESYSTLLVKKGFESLANLKGLGYFGKEEA